MHEFKHDVTTKELEAFAETVLGERDLSIKELGQIVQLNPVAWKAWNAARNFTLAEVLVGKEVSLDVSNDDSDLGHRIFGTVREVADLDNSFILLVDEESRNFDPKREEFDVKISQVVWNYIDRMNDVCDEDTAEHILGLFTADVAPHIEACIASAPKRQPKTNSEKAADLRKRQK